MIRFLIFIFYLISFYFFYRTLIQIHNIETSMNYIKHYQQPRRKPVKKIVLLIPVYKEHKIIRDTINYFKKICDHYNLTLYFISTAREGTKEKNKTFKIISEKTSHKIRLIHCPYWKGFKASQLNYAIDILIKKIKNPELVYIGIFDADSRPDFKAFDFILQDREFPCAYQMNSIYSKNYNLLSNLNKANAIFQTRWSLSFEMTRTILNFESDITKRLMYFIGHGLFLRLTEIIREKFPEDSITEDITLGYKFSLGNHVWKTIPYFDYSTVPNNILVSIIQSSRWFYGELFLFKNYLHYVRENKFSFKTFFLVIERYFILFQWLLGAPVIVVTLICSIILKVYFAIIIILVSSFFYIYTLHKKAGSFLDIEPKHYFYLLIKSILNFLGPLYGLYRFILKILGIKDYGFIKTKR